jgi:hypothetical protein
VVTQQPVGSTCNRAQIGLISTARQRLPPRIAIEDGTTDLVLLD